jgi:hypothetical protein
MPSRIARQLQETAKTCRVLSVRSKDDDIAAELKKIAADLDTKAQSLNEMYAVVEAI